MDIPDDKGHPLDGLIDFADNDRRRLLTIGDKLYAAILALAGGGYTNRRKSSRALAAFAVRDAYAYLIAIGGNADDIRRACDGELNRQREADGLANTAVSARGAVVRDIKARRGRPEPTDDDFAQELFSLNVSIVADDDLDPSERPSPYGVVIPPDRDASSANARGYADPDA